MREVTNVSREKIIRLNMELQDGDEFCPYLIFDDEWVLQGEDRARYSQSELECILKELKELNKPKEY